MTDEPAFLTLDEIKELTGAGTRRRVIENLARNGIRHTIKANGWPAVAWAAVTGTKKAAKEAEEKAKKWEPAVITRLREKGAWPYP